MRSDIAEAASDGSSRSSDSNYLDQAAGPRRTARPPRPALLREEREEEHGTGAKAVGITRPWEAVA